MLGGTEKTFLKQKGQAASGTVRLQSSATADKEAGKEMEEAFERFVPTFRSCSIIRKHPIAGTGCVKAERLLSACMEQAEKKHPSPHNNTTGPHSK